MTEQQIRTMIGILDSITIEPLTASLIADADIGDTVLELDSVLDFDDEGLLSIEGVQLQYASVDEDAETVTLTDPLELAFVEGDIVRPLETTGEDQQTWMANVQFDDDQGAMPVPIRTALIPYLREGIEQRGVRVSVDVINWLVEDLPDLLPASAETPKFYQDTHTVTELGDQVVQLSYLPLDHSEHVYWHPKGAAGIYQAGSEWTRDELVLTVADELDIVRVGDIITVEYAYLVDGTQADPAVEPEPEPDPDPEAYLLTPTNAVVLSSSPNYQGQVVGAAPQWGDDNLGTYVVMKSKFGTGATNRFQGSETEMDPDAAIVIDPDARIAVWLKTISDNHPTGLRIVITETAGSGAFLKEYAAAPGPALTAPAGWEVSEMEPYPGHTISSVLNMMKTDQFFLFMVPDLVGVDPPGTVYSEIHVAEARIAIYYPEP